MALLLTHVSLLVEDVPRALQFYHSVLGLQVDENFGNYATLKANEHLKLSLFTRSAMESALPYVRASQVNGHRSVIEFLVDDLDDFTNKLRNNNVAIISGPTERVDWGIRTVYVEDPDRNLVEFFEYLEIRPPVANG